jgi:quercetin dioxygenase-like cupin family protein
LGSDRVEVVLGEIEYGGQADPHSHSDIEQAFFVLQGKAEVEIEGEKKVVGPDDFIFLPPGTIHRVTPLKGPPLRLFILYAPPLSSKNPSTCEEEK